ncbi:MAG: hypothetical protein RIQ81_316 [Pseudomonadota bacterium]|jgi:hypothetical protein
MRVLLLALVVALGSCKTRDSASSEKSIVDSEGRVFGLIASPGQGKTPTKFEFRLCKPLASRRPIATVINDPNVCINPYLDVVAQPLVISGETFNRIDEAEASLKSRGFRKGAFAAVGGAAVGVVGGVVFGIASGGAVCIAYGMTIESATMVTVAGSTAVGGGGGGMLGYSVWGANDRDAANNIGAILSDFQRPEKVKDVVRILRTFGEQMSWRVVPEVDQF